LVFLYVGVFLAKLPKILAILFLLVILSFNAKLYWQGLNNPLSSALYNKEQVVKEILSQQPTGQDFYVSYIKQLGWNFGFDYLFKYYGHVPQTNEAKKPIYTIVIPKSLSPGNLDFVSGNIGVIVEK
jgi:hypothetical protein